MATILDSRFAEYIDSCNVDAWGVCDTGALAESHPELFGNLHRHFSRAVVLGKRLLDEVVEGVVDKPTTLYFHMYRQVNYYLDRAALEVASFLQGEGFPSMAVPASQQISRLPPTSGHISHVALGCAAGMGWVGRNQLLVHPKYGLRMRYVSILTDAPLAAGRPVKESCGECMACVSACPAGAVRERREDFDVMACYRKLTEFSKLPFIGQHVCGICVKACRGIQ
jgi:epoxyqueuosine reductase QueG